MSISLGLTPAFTPDESDYEMARREFEFAKRSLPNDAEIESALGRIDRDEGKWDEAITHLERAASLDPNTPERWHRLFATYEQGRDFPAAAQIGKLGSVCKS